MTPSMEMDVGASDLDACQLSTRHWVIKDENGHVDRVDGSGVVGQHPVMKPGALHHWISGVSFKTCLGRMSGHFSMKNLRNGGHSMVEILCPEYILRAPKIFTIDD
uniref:ApaG domain-containing protein n=1 Tax=Romanomermis culicivorax TaxID=13658 RepID=A0A915HJY7_ROMCU